MMPAKVASISVKQIVWVVVLPALVFPGQRAAVVADEEEERVFPNALAREFGHHVADRIIHALAHCEERIAVRVAGIESGNFVGASKG